MGPKDEASAKPAEIGNALVESLGFEPADSKKLGRNAVADVSEQISDAGFEIADAVSGESDGAIDSSNGSDTGSKSTGSKGTSSKSTASKGKAKKGSNGSASTATSESDSDSKSGSNGSKKSKKGDSAKSTASAAAGNAATDAAAKTDDAKAAADAELKRILGADPNDTVVMPGPPGDEIAAASGGVTSTAKDKDDLVESLVTAGTMAATAVPTSPPVADDGAEVETDAKAKADVKVKSDPDVPTGPAITGEHGIVEVNETPIAVETTLADDRTVIDKPKSVSDMFSGGITGRRRLQARKVRRVIRHIDPWSVMTFSVLFHLCLFAALLLASVLVWNVADEAGTIENVENFIRELGDYETFEIDGEAIFRAAVAIAGIMTLAASVLVVLLTVVFNLLSDLLGGVRVTVIEEETVRVKPKKGQK